MSAQFPLQLDPHEKQLRYECPMTMTAVTETLAKIKAAGLRASVWGWTPHSKKLCRQPFYWFQCATDTSNLKGDYP